MKKNCMMRVSKSFPDAEDCIPAAAKKKFVKEANEHTPERGSVATKAAKT